MKTIQLALRSLLHYKQYSIINILGLALSFACVIIIFRYVYGEYTVDRFNKNINRIFVSTLEERENPGQLQINGIVNINNQEHFPDLTQHAGVERFSHFVFFENDEIEVDNRKFSASVFPVDSNFLKIMDFPIMMGVEQFSDPHSAMVTEEFAQRIFGNENPIGKTFRYSNGEILTITGVIGQTSTKSTLTFDILISYHLTRFWSRIPMTLVLLHPNVDYQTINQQYEDFFALRSRGGREVRYQLLPLSKLYLHEGIHWIGPFAQGNRHHINILMAVGLLILLAGFLNYINIHTVVMLRRSKELAIKKVFGAEPHSIFLQLLIDNLLQIALALFLAFAFVSIANPLVTNVLQLGQIQSIRFDVSVSFAILLVLPFIATLYPFYRYRYSTPIYSLRNFGKICGGGNLRKVFLTLQYVITIVLVIVSLFFVRQVHFMLNSDLGYRTENIIKVQFIKPRRDALIRDMGERERQRENENRMKDEITHQMNASPLFSQWTSGSSPNSRLSGTGRQFQYLDGGFKSINRISSNADWLEIFDIQLLDGRLWDDEIDGFTQYRVIVTESTLQFFGITDWRTALLQPEDRLWWSSDVPPEEMETNPPYEIVGIIRDFDAVHLSQPSLPTFFTYSEGELGSWHPLIAAIVPGRTQDAIAFLSNLHDETVGGEFSYSFVEDEIREMYNEDKKIATIYSIFTFIAIFISALGLFGMSLFDIQQRRKEIAIRKINGASIADIINVLLKKYFLSLGISFVIAVPVAIYAINRYLEDFAHRASVSWWLFAVALLLTAGISLLTLIYQTYKAADQNPAEVVKSE